MNRSEQDNEGKIKNIGAAIHRILVFYIPFQISLIMLCRGCIGAGSIGNTTANKLSVSTSPFLRQIKKTGKANRSVGISKFTGEVVSFNSHCGKIGKSSSS